MKKKDIIKSLDILEVAIDTLIFQMRTTVETIDLLQKNIKTLQEVIEKQSVINRFLCNALGVKIAYTPAHYELKEKAPD